MELGGHLLTLQKDYYQSPETHYAAKLRVSQKGQIGLLPEEWCCWSDSDPACLGLRTLHNRDAFASTPSDSSRGELHCLSKVDRPICSKSAHA